MAPPRTQQTARAHAPNFLGKGRQFLADAERALAEGHCDTALLLSVHAAISTVDAVTVALGQVRSKDPDHARSVALLRQVVGSSPEVDDRARQLAGLIAVKNEVEYESRRTRRDEADEAAKRARRLADWAGPLVRR